MIKLDWCQIPFIHMNCARQETIWFFWEFFWEYDHFSWSYFFHLENRTFKNTPQALRIYPLAYTVKYSVNMSCCHPFIYDIHDKCLYVPDICFTVINFMHGADSVSIFFLSVEHPYRTITLHNCLFFFVNFKLQECSQNRIVFQKHLLEKNTVVTCEFYCIIRCNDI